jgi:hypothetical protein
MQEPAPIPGQQIPTIHFGPQETITIADLKVGDFVVRVPPQLNMRGLKVNSAVRTIEDREGWVLRNRATKRHGTVVAGKAITFQSYRDKTLSWPDTFAVIVRRPVKQDSLSGENRVG